MFLLEMKNSSVLNTVPKTIVFFFNVFLLMHYGLCQPQMKNIDIRTKILPKLAFHSSNTNKSAAHLTNAVAERSNHNVNLFLKNKTADKEQTKEFVQENMELQEKYIIELSKINVIKNNEYMYDLGDTHADAGLSDLNGNQDYDGNAPFDSNLVKDKMYAQKHKLNRYPRYINDNNIFKDKSSLNENEEHASNRLISNNYNEKKDKIIKKSVENRDLDLKFERFGKEPDFSDTDNENVIDYFFLDDTEDPGDLNPESKQGVVLHLRDLIKNDGADDLFSKVPVADDNHEEPTNIRLPFKRSELIITHPGKSSSHFTDAKEVPQDEDNSLLVPVDSIKFERETHSPSDFVLVGKGKNLSRKRRQRASSPNTEELHHRRHRRRKRKRRHRHSTRTTDSGRENPSTSELDTQAEESERHQERFFLKSNGPSYVITSASELKKDWCRTVPLKQRISEQNCKSKVIRNNFCYGQCNSFFIPHPGRTGNNVAFQSCAFCKPHKHKWINVTLDCPEQTEPKKETQIMIIESCRCVTEVLQS